MEIPQDEPFDSSELPGQDPLGEIPIHPVQFFSHVFEKQHRPGRIHVPLRADERRERGQVSPLENAPGIPLSVHANGCPGEKILLREALDGIQKRSDREPSRVGEGDDHGGVKGDEAGPLMDGVEQTTQVAEPRKDLGILLDQPKIQMGKEFHGTVPAPLRQDDLYPLILKSRMDLVHLFGRGGQPGDKTPVEHFETPVSPDSLPRGQSLFSFRSASWAVRDRRLSTFPPGHDVKAFPATVPTGLYLFDCREEINRK